LTDTDFTPVAGVSLPLEPGLRLVLAPNPSPMTERGTNTYLLGEGAVSVVDPGPADPAHLAAILAALAPGERVAQILVTHAHKDHSPLARSLAEATGAPVLAFGDAGAGRSPRMAALAGEVGGGEGVDTAFVPDVVLGDGDLFEAGGRGVTAVHTPGHFGNHLCFRWGAALFSGDHVMGWAPSLVSPPDGDLTDFMASCARLRRDAWRAFPSGHGAPIADPAARLDWLVAHRQGREAEILAALRSGPATAYDLATRIYTEVPSALLGAATRNVFAHLVDLTGKRRVSPHGPLAADATFFLS